MTASRPNLVERLRAELAQQRRLDPPEDVTAGDTPEPGTVAERLDPELREALARIMNNEPSRGYVTTWACEQQQESPAVPLSRGDPMDQGDTDHGHGSGPVAGTPEGSS